VYVSLSSDVAPVMGEYERIATALFNAYVGPVIERYVSRLERTLRESGLRQRLLIMQANGGVATTAQTVPIFTIESGPAAGVVGTAQVAAAMDLPNVIATDVGGTTFKVAIIEGGRWDYSRETVLNQYQLRLPMVDVASIGAGGGSIAWVDGRRLRIGPQSASDSPGPACYGLGGEEPTITDADLVLGYLSPERFLGGRMQLHLDRAQDAIRRRIADPLFGGDTLAAAAGIRQVIDSQMADLIRKSTLERGHDPRDIVVFAYGGAGPVHAAAYAAEVGVGRIVVPYFATVHSAYGAALSDVRFSLQHSHPLVAPASPALVEEIYATMEREGSRRLDAADVPAHQQRHERWIEARYRRQVHHLRVAAPERVDERSIVQMMASFEAEYERLFGRGAALKDAGIEFVNYGVDSIGMVQRPPVTRWVAGDSIAPRTFRMTWCPRARGMVRTPIYDGPMLPAGTEIAGPIVIEHPGTTIVVLDGQTALVDEYRNTHIVMGEGTSSQAAHPGTTEARVHAVQRAAAVES
jgi:N-methylhydantoinase A